MTAQPKMSIYKSMHMACEQKKKKEVVFLALLSTLMSYNDQSAQHKQPTSDYFRQFRNPVQNVSPGSDTSGHLK